MTKAPPLSSWHAQRSAGEGGTRVFSREWRAHGENGGQGRFKNRQPVEVAP